MELGQCSQGSAKSLGRRRLAIIGLAGEPWGKFPEMAGVVDARPAMPVAKGHRDDRETGLSDVPQDGVDELEFFDRGRFRGPTAQAKRPHAGCHAPELRAAKPTGRGERFDPDRLEIVRIVSQDIEGARVVCRHTAPLYRAGSK